MPASLEEVRLQGLPPSVFYIADFISVEEEQYLLDKVGVLAAYRDAVLINQDCNSTQASMEATFEKTPANLAI